MKSTASKSKPFQRQISRLSQAGRTGEPFQIDSYTDFFMYFNELGSADEKIGV